MTPETNIQKFRRVRGLTVHRLILDLEQIVRDIDESDFVLSRTSYALLSDEIMDALAKYGIDVP